jgi:hypothetical protein
MIAIFGTRLTDLLAMNGPLVEINSAKIGGHQNDLAPVERLARAQVRYGICEVQPRKSSLVATTTAR